MSEVICDEIRTDIEMLCDTFATAMLNLGIETTGVKLARFEDCQIEIVRDVYDHEERITGSWKSDHGQDFAQFVRYPDGKFFAEHDLLLPHPTRPEMVIEAVEVWGHADAMRYEARLLPAL